MAQTEKKTGTRKEVNEQTARSDAELTKHKKTKFGKKAAGKKKQPAELKNITGIGAEKMASILPSDDLSTVEYLLHNLQSEK